MDLIRADRYVDLGELPHAKGFSKPLTSLSHCLEGQVVLIQAADLLHSKKVIPDYATWAQCVSIYTAVVLTAHPERASSLLTYNAAIAKLSKKFKWPSWIVYDHNFRTEAADTGRTDWGKIDGSIYAQCFAGMSLSAEGWCTLCKSMDHTRETCPYRPAEETAYKRQNSFPRPPAKRPSTVSSQDTICRRWNRSDTYMKCSYGDSCIYNHKCSECSATDHGAYRCPKPPPLTKKD